MRLGLILFAISVSVTSTSAAEVHYTLVSQDSALTKNVPVTFGAAFAPGDMPSAAMTAIDDTGNPVPLQVDVKARHKDGSLRHAVLTINLPRLNRSNAIRLAPGNTPSAQPLTPTALPADFDAVVNLDAGGTRLTASARDLLAKTKPETWLSGPLVGEWWVAGSLRDAAGKPDPHLSARFGIRSYGPNRPLRVEVDVENDWTWVASPRSLVYAAEIRLGGKQVFSKEKMLQQSHTRWRQVFWWDTPINVFIKPDVPYLKKARVIPNYAERDAPIDAMYRLYSTTYHGPMGSGVVSPAMPVTGGRPDIGPLPGWTVSYLLSGEARAAEVTMNAADLSGSFPSHYRNEKTGRPSNTEEFPSISTHYNFVGRGAGRLPLPDYAGLWKGLTAEAAHEPSLAFVPYLLTGERYYLEELQFWSQWNGWGTAPEYHGSGKGLISWDQIRGQAWSLRTLAQAAYITPDADSLKGVLVRQMKANAEWYDQTYTNNRNANIFHVALRASDDATAVAPWMDDFLTWATQYAVQLGFDEFRPFARWKGYFPVQRMIHPDYCYVMATKYYIQMTEAPHRFFDSWAKLFVGNLPKPVRDSGTRPACGTEDMAAALKLKHAGEMAGDASSPGGYPAQMQPALAAAVDAGVPGAEQAWAKFKTRAVQPRGGIEPKWDIQPWSH